MTQTASIWLVILAALVAANLPFMNERWLAVGPMASSKEKSMWGRLAELVLLYFLVGLLALALERRLGSLAVVGGRRGAVPAASGCLCVYPRC